MHQIVKGKVGSGTIWWWSFPKIHLAPNNKHQEITPGAQVEKYHFLTLMLECQAPDGGFEAQQASVCVNLGLLLSQLSPHHNRRKRPCDGMP